MKKVKITEISTVERAIKNKIYPKYSTLIKLSASDNTSKGGVQLLQKDSEVEQRFAVIIPNVEFDKRYIYFAIFNYFDEFFHKYNTGINLQFNNLVEMEIEICDDKDTQIQFADILEENEKRIELERSYIDSLKKVKDYFLDKMFV